MTGYSAVYSLSLRGIRELEDNIAVGISFSSLTEVWRKSKNSLILISSRENTITTHDHGTAHLLIVFIDCVALLKPRIATIDLEQKYFILDKI